MTTIYLIRHGEAEGNLYRRIHGQFDSNITPLGKRQIAALSRRFAAIPVDACYASDLIRTQTTAQAIYRPKVLPLQLEPRFREINLGVWEDLTFGELYTFQSEEMAVFNNDPVHWQVEGSENFETYSSRFVEALDEVAECHSGQTVAIFTHGSVLRGALMRLFPGAPIAHSDNTAVSCITWEHGRYEIQFLNDNSHLDENLSTLAKQRWWREGGHAKDVNLWFRPGLTAIDGLEPPAGEIAYTAYSEHTPVGLLVLSGSGEEKTGVLQYMGLSEPYRRMGLSVQLFGQAIYTFRALGMANMELSLQSEDLAALARQMELTCGEGDVCTVDLRYGVSQVDLTK